MTPPFENAFPAMKAVKDVLYRTILPYARPKAKNDREGGGKTAGGGRYSGSLTPAQWKKIGKEVMSLHQVYTKGGTPLRHDSNPIHEAMAGYQLYFLPRNMLRVHRVLNGLPWSNAAAPELLHPWLEREGNRPVLRILDLGCGSGAFGLAWLAWLASRFPAGQGAPEVHLTLVDQGRRLMDLAQKNLSAFAREALPGTSLKMEIHASGVERFLGEASQGPPFAVAGGAMMLGEMNLLGPRRVSGRAEHFCEALRRRVRDGGCIVFVEPGTRKGYMNLMAVRDRLAGLPVLYPCPHGEKCPMWHGRVTGWCHAAVPLPQPFFFDGQLKRTAGIRFEMREINLSALAVQVTGVRGTAVPGTTVPRTTLPGAGHPFQVRQGSRVVSAPLAPKSQTKHTPARNKPVPGGGKGKRKGKPGQNQPDPLAPKRTLVLVCESDGRLHERPAGQLGRLDRGRWLEGDGETP